MGKTLVTGAGGLVGYAIKQLNPPDTIYLTRKEVDLTDFDKIDATMAHIRPSRVIHLAATVGGIGGNMIHSGEYFRSNIMINTNVLESARRCGVKKLISFMSTCVFPNTCTYPLNEKDLHNGPPHPSNFGYAYAKRMLEVQSSAYRNEWNCDYIVAIPTNIYGPNDDWNLSDGHVIPSLIHRCFLSKKTNSDLVVWGSGKPLREFVFSDDIAKLASWALDNYSEDSPIIFSSGIEISIRDLVELVASKMKFDGKLIFDSTKPDGQYRKPSDTTKLRKYLPDFVFTPIEEGIEKSVDWFVTNYPNLRK
ncbi:MAG: GDP-L-fucose synthase [Desulfobacterales bacterium]|nr:GDP-L-fucose synthase [Desulfobacterales bacterium]